MANKYNLFLETLGTDINLMILNQDQEVLKVFKKTTHQDMIETIIDDIDTLLKELSLNKNDISNIFWVSQPGLYTGMRIGSLICKAWATNHKTMIYEINRLELQSTNNCLSLVDAKGNKYYLQIFINDQPITDILLVDEIELKKYQEKYPDIKTIIDAPITKSLVESKIKLFKKIDINNYHLPYYKSAC